MSRFKLSTWIVVVLMGCPDAPGPKDALDTADPDGDGWGLGEDCDDENPAVNPEASDVRDGAGVDQNCDGVDGTDADQDGEASVVTGGGDCDDDSSAIHTAADERCDGRDNDCDGEADEDDAVDASVWYADRDDDGYGDVSATAQSCTQPVGFAANGWDCDDQDPNAWPGGVEVPYDGSDNDCDAASLDDDLDGDGVGAVEGGGEDCDDGDATSYSGAEEICGDGVVNDCESDTPEAMAACGFGGEMDLSDADLKLAGINVDDQAGWSGSATGDLDGDGKGDIIIGAITVDRDAFENAGAAYIVLSGGALGGVTGTHSLASADVVILGENAVDYAGGVVSVVRAAPDAATEALLVGAHLVDVSEPDDNAGAAYLLRAEGVLLGVESTLSLQDADLKLTGLESGGYAGYGLAGLGDIDGDELGDYAVGAYGENRDGANSGTTYVVLSGGELSSTSGTISLTETDLYFAGESYGDIAGYAISGVSDLDGDGKDELLIGAQGVDSGSDAGVGAAYLIPGADVSGRTTDAGSLADAHLKLLGDVPGEGAGFRVARADDVDGDGAGDLLIGAPDSYAISGGAGSAYLVFGGSLAGRAGVVPLLDVALTLVGEAEGDNAGLAVSGLGDVDSDGRDDVGVGAPMDGNSGSGSAYVLLAASLPTTPGTLSLGAADLVLGGEASGARAGATLFGVGDHDDDGFDDLLVGVPEANSIGAAHLLLGGGF